jgi:hypothetical protein
MQKSIKYIFLLFFIAGLNNTSFTQALFDYSDISVFFGDKYKSGASAESLEKTKSGDLLYVQNKRSLFNLFSKNNSKYSFDLITEYSLPKSKPIKFYGDGEKTNLINYTFIGNQVLGLSYRTSFLVQNPTLYYHQINPEPSGKSNHGFPISSFNSMRNIIDLSRISMISSKEANFAALLYIPKTKTDEYTSIKYVILKSDYSVVNENEFLYPYPSEAYEPLDYFIFDEKEQIFITGHYTTNNLTNTSADAKAYYKNISITKITNNQLSTETIQLGGKYFTDLEAYAHEEGILIGGLYSSFIDGQIEGTYIAIINKDGKLKNNHFTPFSKKLTRSIRTFEENYFSQQIEAQAEYRKFNVLDFKTIKDGYILSAEFNAVEYRFGGTDVPGATNVIDTYYWSNDIIISKIDFNGQLIWNKIIPKIQRSINDGGYYLSSATYSDDEKLHLFFNDHLSNYNEEGMYNKNGDTPMPAQLSSSKNTIAHVSIDLKQGNIKRKSTIGKAETNVLFVPKISVAYEKKLMIYGRSGRTSRIGSIIFSQ